MVQLKRHRLACSPNGNLKGCRRHKLKRKKARRSESLNFNRRVL